MRDAAPPHRPAGHGVPDEQRDVLALVAAGWTDERIAQALSISVSTVQRRLHAAGRLLGVRSRPALVARAYEVELLPAPPPLDLADSPDG